MKLDIFNIEDFIKANKCQEVSNPVYMNFDGTYTSDGIFSYEIFGFSDEDRKNIFAYIDLKGHYLHPLIYLTMNSKMGSLGKVLRCEKYAVIADHKIKFVDEDFTGAETGIDFLYDHFEEINWIDAVEEDEISSIDKKTRLKFLKSLKKNEFFVSKWLVLPPFYRAESSLNRSMGDNINKLYKELISRCRGMDLGFSFQIFNAETKLRIQNILKDLYLSTTAPISGKNLIITNGKTELAGSGKNSMIRKHLLGKTVDWSASSVITSPVNSNANTPEEKPVRWGYSSFPIATLLAMFQPFYLNWCSDFLNELLVDFYNDYSNEISKINFSQFSSEVIEKYIKQFIKDPEDRFSPITFEFVDKDGDKSVGTISFYEYKTESDMTKEINYRRRTLTLVDLFYIASLSVLNDKHVFVTRFPIANYQNIYPAKINVLSTTKTRPVWISFGKGSHQGGFFANYPIIPESMAKKTKDNDLYDVMLCGNAYLDSLGGDYDGDMLYMRALFTKEANDEAEKMIYAKTNMLNATGDLSRGLSKIGKECCIGLFELSKEGN